MSRLIRVEICSNFSYLLGFCSKVNSQVHRHLRQVLTATWICSNHDSEAWPRKLEPEDKTAFHARDPGPHFFEGNSGSGESERNENSDWCSNRSITGPGRKRCENRKKANIRTPEMLPNYVQE